MDSSTRLGASPATPLFPLSPERVNGTRPPYSSTVSQSSNGPEFGKSSVLLKPSLLSGSPEVHFRHTRNNSASDAHVQGLVARFDGLSVKDYKAQSEVAVRRADMAREMAEMERDKSRREAKALDDELKRVREEMRKMRKEIEEGKERERKVSKRLEVVMEEHQRSKDAHSHAVGIYEKEIRKCRKEAFRSGSSLVKLQEELKATRNSLRTTQSSLESEKLKSARREQDAFTAQYQLISVQEELDKMQERVQVVEAERDALKRSLKEEEVARIAAEGRIALPAVDEDEDFDDSNLSHSARKSPRKVRLASEESDCDKENRLPKKVVELQSMHRELAMERRLRKKAQEQVEFMKMECQFQCCSCRLAERDGHAYVYDISFASEMDTIRTQLPNDCNLLLSDREDMPMTPGSQETGLMTDADASTDSTDVANECNDTIPEPNKVPLQTSEQEKETSQAEARKKIQAEVTRGDTNRVIESEQGVCGVAEADDAPQTPIREIRTVTTTTTIPIMFSPFPRLQQPTTPMTIDHPPSVAHGPTSPFLASAFKPDGTLDREAALAQIRERRGRARSVAIGHATPKKQMLEGVVGGRRDISAPTLKNWN
ncbi:uncharacterized protein PV09_08668 [Verruconis gallopava]|uniref:Uncharacterized protein n=1 Tax=Verruconis gallopava TaxID=253628 RepID=A0A0D1ZZ84_9PEZI|nr:uncharacterized protein PV09_08668 [Verruconis gallopava]KIV99747.1 hypothetical protein PV09_08668 [Verruconis gallopava]